MSNNNCAMKSNNEQKIGKYNVYLQDFEKSVSPLWPIFDQVRPLILVMDEIGKMECLSDDFCTHVQHCLTKADDSVFFIFTVAFHGKAGLMRKCSIYQNDDYNEGDLKLRKDMHMITVTKVNRDRLKKTCLTLVQEQIIKNWLN